MKKCLVILLGLILTVSLVTDCFAQTQIKKLERGAINTVTGWLEVPKVIYETSVEENVLSGLTFGFVEGCGLAIVRIGAGIYEVLTFPFEVPEGYVPVLEPEFVFTQTEVIIVEVVVVEVPVVEEVVEVETVVE